jgi:hypothetical protein
MAKARVESSEKVEDLTGFRNMMADRAQLIDETLEFSAVLSNGEITLTDAAEFGLKIDCVLEFIVVEETFDLGPEGVGGEVGLVDYVENGFGEGEKNPVDDASINQLPVGVMLADEGGSADVFGQAELAENGIKEATPLGVVGFVEIQHHRNVGADVDNLDDRGSSGVREREIRVVGVVGGRSHGRGGGGC